MCAPWRCRNLGVVHVGWVKREGTREVRRVAEAAVQGSQSTPQTPGGPPRPAQLTQGCREEEEAWVEGLWVDCRCGFDLGWGSVPWGGEGFVTLAPKQRYMSVGGPLGPRRGHAEAMRPPRQAPRGMSLAPLQHTVGQQCM